MIIVGGVSPLKIMRKLAKWIVLAVFVAVCAVLIVISNGHYDIVEYTVSSDRLPAAFDGFRIAQISDLHSRRWDNLAEDVAAAKPDIIVISGDLVRRGDSELPTALIEKLVAVAPVYFAPGNHEADNENYPAMREEMISLGVQVLEDASAELVRTEEYADRSEESRIRIAGIVDPTASAGKSGGDGELRDALDASLEATVDGSDVFTVLIAHRPEYKILYEAHSVDVVFSGHAHGGGVRIPLIGEIWAPGQGFFPAYVGGVYESEYTALVVSRGLGKSSEPFRLNCPYELVICTLTQG